MKTSGFKWIGLPCFVVSVGVGHSVDPSSSRLTRKLSLRDCNPGVELPVWRRSNAKWDRAAGGWKNSNNWGVFRSSKVTMEAAGSRAHVGVTWSVKLQWISGKGGKVALGGHDPGDEAGETLADEIALDEGGRERVNLISEATDERRCCCRQLRQGRLERQCSVHDKEQGGSKDRCDFWGRVGKGPEELVCLFCLGVAKLGDVGGTRGRLEGEGCRKF